MCGFIGYIRHQRSKITEQERALFVKQNEIITHRGPDDEGFYHDDFISFGFRRLSIIDIESGHQPLPYENERYWMVFNGEIYNYVELKKELLEEGYEFETDSDSEVILAMFSKHGDEAFKYLRGMFGILIWDKSEEVLHGARDPFGIKPLFYSRQENGTYFASEKKSIGLAIEQQEVDAESLQHYLSFQFVPEPKTMTKGVRKIEPGHSFTMKPGEDPTFKRYFHAKFDPVQTEKQQLMRQIRDVMFDSVNVHMRSDVPVGSFLSGGIDSTIIVAIAKEFNPNIKTFSVGFEREGYSEVDVARESAEKIGVENISYVISPEEYVKKLPKIMWHNDDPLADPACVPLYFVGREASKHVTVVLSGEGADELFGGYNIYREPESLKVFKSVPTPAKDLLNRVAKVLPEGVKGKSFLERGTTPLSERYIGNAKMFEEAEKSALLKTYDQHNPYQKFTNPLYREVQGTNPVNQMQYVDIHTWLRGDILLKADRMTMAHALELRVPFLDKEVFRVANSIPVDYKIANGTTKSILREAMESVVPEHVLNRKKLGFPVPIRHWLRNELYDWAAGLIKNSQTDYLLNKDVVINLLEKHREGKQDYSRKIWTVLMFMLWHQIYIEGVYSIEELQIEDEAKSKLTTK
ncbi:asparagine synthase (glutamine-hydrolyzing) [Halalkalibacillus sediminis]|uniref:asparagine synthase (glutamine-hydrolyzing) n=1 Tax=Halalkalibacillus sediminis TaxID=2018042 RepID=A0A2I0QV24_9BACI|nr:asparagine synthase (glutamine-hydrolyzing) [Halalkalibacillus sediminis]PKR78144.1 asparagine synthase (glutamine-hydrolyzing) [Halalkalibacillus sediminis]